MDTTGNEQESKSRYAFIWGLASGFVAAALLTPIAIFSTLGATEPADEPARAALSRPEACQAFYGNGGAAGELFIDRMNAGLKKGNYDPEALSLLLARVDTGLTAAMSVQELESSSYSAYRELAETGEALSFALTAANEAPDEAMVRDFASKLEDVATVCNAPVE